MAFVTYRYDLKSMQDLAFTGCNDPANWLDEQGVAPYAYDTRTGETYCFATGYLVPWQRKNQPLRGLKIPHKVLVDLYNKGLVWCKPLRSKP